MSSFRRAPQPAPGAAGAARTPEVNPAPPVAGRWRSAAALPRWAARRWRRSVQLRVVAATLLLSTLVVALLGLFLIDRVGRGLVEDKRRAALADASSGRVFAQSQLASADRQDPRSIDALLEATVVDLGRRGSPSGLFDAALLPTGGTSDGYISGPLNQRDIPQPLRVAVRQGVQAETFAAVSIGGRRVRALIIGAPITETVGSYELYYVFPLTAEQQTMNLVRRTLAIGGAVLVLLLGAVVALVSRSVVTPVRVAARVAERFAAGRLSERVPVKGEDEVARLGRSFNDMAAALSRQIDQLEELSRLARRFTADVSHELRTPLTTVRMAADMLHEVREEFSPPAARATELLVDQLERFERLLVDLLEISRYDAQAAVLEAEPTDLAGLVRLVAGEFEAAAIRAGCRLDLTELSHSPVMADVDPRRVARILRNLLANAVDHAEGRPVEVALAVTATTVAVRIRDHGIGMLPEDVSRVFDRFWRADASRARSTGGTGLGLAIAQEDARLHGGELVAWGRPGRGSSFRLLLPRRAGDALGPSPLAVVPAPGALRPTRVAL